MAMTKPWENEEFHDDENFELLKKEKRAKARARQAKADAAALRDSPSPEVRAVGTIIRECAPDTRCGSGADIQCGTATRRSLVKDLKALFDRSTSFLTATVVPAPDPLAARNLANFDVSRFTAELTERLADAGLGTIPVTGAIDISLNTYTGVHECQLWVPHWTLFFPDCDRREVSNRLSRVFHRTQFVEKPVYVQEITKTPHIAFSYAYKTLFYEIGYRTTEHGARRIHELDPIKIVVGHPSFEHLAFHLDRIGLAQRIFRQNQ